MKTYSNALSAPASSAPTDPNMATQTHEYSVWPLTPTLQLLDQITIVATKNILSSLLATSPLSFIIKIMILYLWQRLTLSDTNEKPSLPGHQDSTTVV